MRRRLTIVPARRSDRVPLPRGFWTIWTTVALDLVGFGIIVPILGRYAERFGASGLEVGLLFASFSLAQLVFAPILGRLSDRVGRRPIIILSLVGTCVGSIVTGAAGALWVLFLGRIIDGASGASVSVAQAAVTDIAEPEERPRLLGLLGAAFGVGFVVGPALGGLASLGGPHVPFYVAAALAGANAIAAWVRLPETRSVQQTDDRERPTLVPDDRAQVPAARRPVTLTHFAILGFVSMFAFAGFEATFALFASARFGLTEGSTAAVFLGVGLLLVIVQGGAIAPVTAAIGSGRVLRVGLVLSACGLGVLAITGDGQWALLTTALGLVVIGQGLTSPSLTTLVSEHAPHDRRGEALGLQQSAAAIARVTGPVTAGLLFDGVGVGAPSLVGGALMALAALLAVVWHLSSPRPGAVPVG
jgi:multidrug resistance protein